MTDKKRDYPDVITPEELDRQAHVDTKQIRNDLLDTLREIYALGKVQEADVLLAKYHLSDTERKLADYRAQGRPAQMAEREQLANFLRKLLAARGTPAISQADFNNLAEFSFTPPVSKTPGLMWRKEAGERRLLGMYVLRGDEVVLVETDARELIVPEIS